MKKSKHVLSHDVKLSCNMGELIPAGIVEVLPGEIVDMSTNALIRTQPLLAPIMHKVDVTIHQWFVPTRLIWDDFEKFITGGEDGNDATVPPYITSPASTGYAIGSLADYFGLPTGVASRQHSALPFRAYNLIWNEFYRDEDLQTKLVISKGNGSDTTTSVALQNVCWGKDYFTSASPFPQKGDDVVIPLTGDAPVVTTGNAIKLVNSGQEKTMTYSNDTLGRYRPDNATSLSSPSSTSFGSDTGLEADLSGVTGVSISALRMASAIQRFRENMMRAGSRYVERLMQLGVRPADARLQLPEYLAGGKSTLQFSEVLATAETGSTVDVGDMKGHGISGSRSNRFRRHIPEHGYVITLMFVMPKTMYPQALNRMWSRTTKEHYWQPELQHTSQQEVLNKEVYWAHTTPEGVFGYQDVYDEYRRQESRVAGEFRDTLNYWHMARIFSSSPALNASFVSANPTNRIYAATSADQLYIAAYHNIVKRSPVAKAGTSFLK